MITWLTAVKQAQDSMNLGECPVPQKIWCAYGGGKVIGESTVSRVAASRYPNCSYVECVLVNKPEIDAWYALAKEAERAAEQIWHAALRKEFPMLSDTVFDICVQYLYDQDSNYDNIATGMYTMSDVALKIMKSK